jgi:hypothetical protein
MEKLWVYLDDARPLPDGYDLLVRTAEEAIELIKEGKVEHISLDNDLGTGYTEGKKVAQFIEQAYVSGQIEQVKFKPHTSNPVAFDEIKLCAYNCWKHSCKLKNST